jgi:hypothetical protein
MGDVLAGFRGHEVWSTKFRVQSSKFRVQSSEFKVKGSKYRVQSSEFRGGLMVVAVGDGRAWGR